MKWYKPTPVPTLGFFIQHWYFVHITFLPSYQKKKIKKKIVISSVLYPDKIQMYTSPLAKSPIWWPSLFPGYMHVTTDSAQCTWNCLVTDKKHQLTTIHKLWIVFMNYEQDIFLSSTQQSFPPLPHPYRSLLTHWLLSTAMIYIFQVHLQDITILTHTVYDMRYRQSHSLESHLKLKSQYTCTVYWHFLMPEQVSWRAISDQHTDPGDKSL